LAVSRQRQDSECEPGRKVHKKERNSLEIVGLPGQHCFGKGFDVMLNSRKERNIKLKLYFWNNMVL